jgi:hypothetical protein
VTSYGIAEVLMCVGHLAHVQERERETCKIVVENPKGRDHLEYLCVVGRILMSGK